MLGYGLGTGWRILFKFNPNHENVTNYPYHYVFQRHPAEEREEAKYAAGVLGVFYVPERELCDPRYRFAKTNAIVCTSLAQQLVHPEMVKI